MGESSRGGLISSDWVGNSLVPFKFRASRGRVVWNPASDFVTALRLFSGVSMPLK